MTSVDLRTTPPPAASGPRRPRASWHVRANAVVVTWLALTVLALLAQRVVPQARWLAIHVFLLGAVTNAILTWSEHFATTLLRAAEPAPRWSAARLVTLNAAVVGVLTGVTAARPLAATAGAGLVVATVGWHTLALLARARRSLHGRFAHVVAWYVASGAALVVGGTLGGLMVAPATPPAWHERLHLAHVQANVFGFVAFAVLGTLFTLWPTVLRTRLVTGVDRAARWAWRLTVPGLALAVGALLAGARPAAAAGLALYAAGVLVALAPFARTTRRRAPHSGASWLMAAGTAWLAVTVAGDLAVVAVGWRLDTLVPVLVVGFVGQVLLGALTYLLPVVLGGGPAGLKRMAAVLDRAWLPRLIAVNLGVLLVAVPVPAPLPLAGWGLVGAALAAFVALTIVAVAPSVRVTPLGAAVAVGVALTLVATSVAAHAHLPAAASAGTAATGRTVAVTLADMRILPSVIDATPGERLTLRVTNRDTQPHDLWLAGGAHTPLLDPGRAATLRLAPLTAPLDGWCTVPGHRAAGMTLRIRLVAPSRHDHGPAPTAAVPATPPTLDLAATPSPGWRPYDAALAPALPGVEHRVEIHAVETDLEVAPGVRQRMWTFNGTVPGPVLRGRVGDVFTVTFVNEGTMGHGIDFHAGALAPDVPMRTIQPAERLTYRFRATRAGAWLYHCSTAPMLQHIGNGMYGAVVIDPPGLPRVDREYVLVASELYLGQPGSAPQVAKMRAGTPDAWMFNGFAAGYDHAPLTARVGERVRIWVVAAGPGSGVAFHVVGTNFDTVYKEGGYLLRPSDPGGAQVLDLVPAQGGFVETAFPEPGTYPFVDHDMRHGDAGAHGLFRVGPR